MKTEDKEGWLKDQLARVEIAERKLVSAKKQRVSEFDERLRMLSQFRDGIFIKLTDSQQQELFSPEEMLSPALDKLLAAPLRGLE